MMRPGWPGDGAPSIESLRELRLRALLNDLVNDLGPVKAAEQLGIDRKTLWRSAGAGEMSPRLIEALERLLLERAAADGQRVKALEERVAGLERQLAAATAAANSSGDGGDVDGAVVAALREEFAQDIQQLERRVERLESVRGSVPGAAGGGSRASQVRSQRRYPDLVTREPAGDDEQVYAAAWPLVDEWRRLWDSHTPLGRGLAWVSRRERILELEVAMLEEHGLTLPQETTPLRGLDRGEQLNWRVRELAGVRRQRARLGLLRWAGRVLTLGLWR